MKLTLLIAFCVAVAAATYNPTITSSVFKPGEEYVYHYKGQIVSGIPKSSKQYGGIFIDSIVLLQFQQDYKVVMKMEKIKLFKINNKISTLPSEPLPESDLTRLTGEQASVITQSLVKPIKFRYEEGDIRELEKEIYDPYWSVNIKKGVLSLFQVTLKEKTSYSSDSSSFYPDPVMSRVRSYRPRGFSPMTPYWKLVTKSNVAYKVVETDVMGTCESKYAIITDKDHLSPSSSEMRVSRVKNFESCVNKPYLIEGLFQGVHRSHTEKDLMQPTVHTDYIISGDRTHFLIKEAKLRGKYFFLVNGLQGGDLSTYIFQHLTLKTVEPIRQPIHLTTPKIDQRGLLMVIPKASLIPEKQNYEEVISNPMFSRRHQPSQQQFVKSYEREQQYNEEYEESYYQTTEQTELVPIVERKLEELVECLYTENVEKKCSSVLYELSRYMREMNKEQLKQVIVQHIRGQQSSASENSYRKSEIVLDILPTLPSPDAAKVLIELIKEKVITELRGSLLIKAMTMLVKPTPSIIKKTFELFKELPKESSYAMNERSMLRQSLLLGVGTLSHRLVNVMRTQGKPVPEIINFVETISLELNKWLEETTTEEENILVLKAIGNMGASENIVTLKNIIEDPRQTPVIRLNAIYALRRLARQFDKQVTPILLSTFMDVKEVSEIRQAAFIVLFNAKPSYTTLQMIAHRIRHEPNSQIRTLVYSSLVNLAMYTHHQPELKEMSKNARLVMKTLPPIHIGVHDSISVLLNKFSEEYDFGGSLNILKIKSKLSGLPESIVANLQGTLFGKHRRLIEVGATGKSLEMILRKFFGPHGLLKEYLKGNLGVEDILKPLTRVELGQVEQKIRQILSQMMMESRPELEPFGITSELYLHVLGNELQFITLNSQNIHEIINKVTRVLPEILMKLSRGVNVDVLKTVSHIASLTVASPLGIPLSLNATTMALLKVQGHIKVENLPTFSDMLNRFTSLEFPKLVLNVDLKPCVDVSQTINMGPDMRWFSAGVGAGVMLKSKLPIKLIAKVDPVEHSLTLKKFVPKESKKLLEITATPYTFVKYQPVALNKIHTVLETREIKSEEIVKEMPYNFNYKCGVTGLEVEAQGVYSLCGPAWCPIMPFFGKQELTLITRPVTNVDFVQLKIKSVRSNLEFEGIPISYSPEQLFMKDSEEFEEEQRFFNIHNTNRREVSRSMLSSGEFEPIPVSPVLSSQPIKRQVLVTLGPNTQESPKIKALLTWLMSRRYWENQLNVQVVRMGYSNVPAWKIFVDQVVNPLVFYPEESYKNEPISESKLKWNIFGQENEIKIKIVPGSPFDFTRELREHSILPIVDNLPEATAQKFRYTVEVEIPQMTHKLMKYITVAHDLLKYQFFTKLTTAIPVQPLNKIYVAFEVLPWWEKLNVIVKTPREVSYISAIPFYWNPFQPTSEKLRLHDVPAWKWYKSLEDKEYFLDTVPYKTAPVYNNKCTVSPTKVTTFDGITVPLEKMTETWEPNCELVIAQHCSNEALFSVLGSGSGEALSVKVIVPKHEITISTQYRRLTVRVNGEEKYLTEGSNVVVRDPYTSKSEVEIEKLSNEIIEIHHKELGLKVFVDANTLKTTLKLSPWSMLQGQLCGLCGNFNQDQSDDYYTSSDFQTKNRDLFKMITKNVLKSETCNIDKFRTTTSNSCMKPIRKVITRYDNKMEMTCNSETAVPQCAPGCQPASTTFIKTCFTCLSPDSRPVQSYIPARWDAYENDATTCSNFHQRVEVPTRCVPAY